MTFLYLLLVFMVGGLVGMVVMALIAMAKRKETKS